MGQKLRRAPVVYETDEAKETLAKAREERRETQKELELLGGIEKAQFHLDSLTAAIEEKQKTIEVLHNESSQILKTAGIEAKAIVQEAEKCAADIKTSEQKILEEAEGLAAGLTDREDAVLAREKHLEDEWDKLRTHKIDADAVDEHQLAEREGIKRSWADVDNEKSILDKRKQEAQSILDSLEEVNEELASRRAAAERAEAASTEAHARARGEVKRAQEIKGETAETLRQANEQTRLNLEKEQAIKADRDKLQEERMEVRKDKEAFLIAKNRVFGKETEERVNKVMSGGT